MEEGPLRVWIGAMPDVDLADRTDRLSLVPIVRAAVDVAGDRDDLAARYGPLRSDYVLCGPDEAEVAMLARSVSRGDDPRIRPFVDDAERRGLRTLVFGGDDLEPVVGSTAAIVVHPGPTRGAQRLADVLAVPYQHTDRWRGPMGRTDGSRPSVAFCGQAANRLGAGLAQTFRRGAAAARDRRNPAVVTPPVRGHVRLRARGLRALADHPGVDDRFVIRDRYRAGGGEAAARARAEHEFDENLRGATYALCVRGTGNFSARFVEALSFGRIPLFVDTACVLPFEDEIDWDAHLIRVDARDIATIGDSLVAAHRTGTDGQRSAASLRALWEDRLTQAGFYGHLPSAVRRLL
jgi:hypothetical protein